MTMVVASFGDGHIALSYRRKELTLPALEFIRRFSLHILPSGLVRIRHYGILGNNRRKPAIENSARDLQMPRACRGASAAERCRQTDALSVCAEKPEFVLWPLPMPPALCTYSAPGQCHAIHHDNSPNT